ncbi:hypothetical protein NDU88_006759 [Pleurodeles waltl]|uniref:Uncharacterized protein n=1 Tax=Pleurodeles waltl TaxID=8319 RepID=A0AAV7VQJ0_PLEWA|nr:hypothetical protein NDU88_006759 [Pleurodeles waltl]
MLAAPVIGARRLHPLPCCFIYLGPALWLQVGPRVASLRRACGSPSIRRATCFTRSARESPPAPGAVTCQVAPLPVPPVPRGPLPTGRAPALESPAARGPPSKQLRGSLTSTGATQPRPNRAPQFCDVLLSSPSLQLRDALGLGTDFAGLFVGPSGAPKLCVRYF